MTTRNIDVTGKTVIETSDGDDVVNVSGTSTFDGGLAANTGHGDDFMQLGNGSAPIEVNGLLDLNTSVGDDTLIVHLGYSPAITTAVIRTSDGKDDVKIRHTVFASLDVNLGLGDDLLSFDSTTLPVFVSGNITLNGSGGFDTLNDDGLIGGSGTRTDKSFEQIV